MNEAETIRDMLGDPDTEALNIAVIGLSADQSKPSHYVSAYLQQQGYRILPVNPALDAVLGESSYSTLTALSIKPDIVNVFRLPRFIPAIVDEMIALNLKNLWVQQGIIDLASASRAETAGIHVVMDRCIMVEHLHARK
jgi:predicted CoA-binding protein